METCIDILTISTSLGTVYLVLKWDAEAKLRGKELGPPASCGGRDPGRLEVALPAPDRRVPRGLLQDQRGCEGGPRFRGVRRGRWGGADQVQLIILIDIH